MPPMQPADVLDVADPSQEWARSLNDPTLAFALEQAQRAFGEFSSKAAHYREQVHLLIEERTRREQAARLARGEPQQPCLATTHAYDTDMACGRPLGHSADTEGARGFTWDQGHAEKPFPTDPPVYEARAVTRFEPTKKVANP